ncbi:MAG: beta-N-acetylhexosaminidase [Eubacteriales bacterium]|nr:beta-N-acetylhexosaminidase [Eubacteriales bacterium]
MIFELSGAAEELRAGIALLAQAGEIEDNGDGLRVTAAKTDHMRLTSDGSRATIEYAEKAQFFRLLSFVKGRKDAVSREETPALDHNGVMLDMSRNGVMTAQTVQRMLRHMAFMGLNWLMLYTEDTYEADGLPYFGYQRGRYTQAELKAIDDYADALGVEVIPCIQTLGHLEKALRWQAMDALRDTSDVLLVDSDEVRAFLKKILAAATAPFRSRRIHLGMDEAQSLGCGRSLEQRGYVPRLELLRRHLNTLQSLCGEMGLSPMIWSDMCLRPFSATDEYYDMTTQETQLPENVVASVPANLTLVYWDYYHHDTAIYETMLRRHACFHNPTIFAGGTWTWNGLAPNYGKAFDSTNLALVACKRSGMRDAFCTSWNDNGAETNLLTALLPMQLFAEHGYRQDTPANGEVFARFEQCCGGKGEDFWDLRLLDETPGVGQDNLQQCNPSKYLLYQDALLGLFDRHAEGLELDAWYAGLAARLRQAKERNPKYHALFAYYEALADALSLKAELGLRVTAAYRAGDREALRAQLGDIDRLEEKLDALLEAFRTLWFSTNKPQGFEDIDVRVSGVSARLRSAKKRLNDWLDGRVDRLDELEQERLWFDGRQEAGPYAATACNYWDRIVSACPIAGV